MFNVTTKYVQINDDRKKVFMIRGDEAYAKTTDCQISYDSSTIVTGNSKGFKIPSITVNIYRNVGSSKVFLYDGDEIIASANVTNSAHTLSFSNIYLAYTVEHEIYAVFKGNDSCLGSKSNKIKESVALPSSLATSITFNNPTTQVAQGGNLTLSMTAKTNNVNVANGTQIQVYDNNSLVDTVTTSSGTASITISSMTKGLHTITATIKGTESINPTTSTIDISVGYDIDFTSYPSLFINNIVNNVTLKVTDWFGQPISGTTVTMTGQQNKGTNSNGIVSYQYASVTNGSTLTASAGGSSSSITARSYTPSNVNVSASPLYVGVGQTSNVGISVEGSGHKDYENIPISLTGGINNTITIYDDVKYVGSGKGTTRITATVGNKSGYVDINDYIMYYTPTQRINFDYEITKSSTQRQTNLTDSGFYFAKSGTTVKFNTSIYEGTMEFDVVAVGNNHTNYFFGMNGALITDTSLVLSANDHIKVTASNGTITVYVNNVSTITTTYTNPSNWMLGLYHNADPNVSEADSSLKINNLKIYKA